MVKQHAVIVVADDDPLINDLISIVLQDEGYRVLSCTTGAEALQVAARVRPDLVITDMQMEVRDAGLQLLDRLRADPTTAEIAVIVCSADIDTLIQRASELRQRRACVIPKPFTLDGLLTTVRQLLPIAAAR